MSYAIICDARVGHSMGVDILMLVDRKKCKQLWWTSDDPTIAIRYEKKSAAEYAARRLKRNSTRVVPFDVAVGFIRAQKMNIIHHEAMSDAEMGWDAHKDWL